MALKLFCYAALVVAFLLCYQNNPVFTLIIIVTVVGAFLFYKSKKNKGSGQASFLFSGKQSRKTSGMDELTTILLLQRFLGPVPLGSPYCEADRQDSLPKMSEKELEIERVKNEILELLRDDW